jgi:hypothetical protein
MRFFEMINWKRAALLSLILAVLFFGVASPAQAAEINNTGKIAAGVTIDDDLIITGDIVQMDGTVNGMLIASGNSITITGTVNGDVFAGGNSVTIGKSAKISGNLIAASAEINVAGTVTGSIAGASAAIHIQDGASVGRNIYYVGYSLEASPQTQVDRSLYGALYQAVLNGKIKQDTNLNAGAVELNGEIGRNMKIDLGQMNGNEAAPNPSLFIPGMNQVQMPPTLKPGLRIGSEAKIGGQLAYVSSKDLSTGIQAQPAGGVIFQTPVPKETTEGKAAKPIQTTPPVVNWILKTLSRLATLIILAALSLWLVPGLLKRSSTLAGERSLPSAGYGFITLLVGFAGAFVILVAIIILAIIFGAISLGGLVSTILSLGLSSLGFVFATFMFLVIYGSALIVSYLIGDRIMEQVAAQASHRSLWAMLVGVVLYVLVRSIPYLGGLVGFVVTLIGLGALWLYYREWRQSRIQIAAPAIPSSPEI